MGPGRKTTAVLITALSIFGASTSASAKMDANELPSGICETKGGGRFVPIKQFPGEETDRRIKADIRYLIRRFNVFITDGYSHDSVHSYNGEHPLGLALDIVPNFANGGSWNDVDRLAHWAEPTQNVPRAPFRWVGYDGDVNHGRGNHLHLSWAHSEHTTPFKPVWTVYSIKCPGKRSADDPDDGVIPPADPNPSRGSGGIGLPRKAVDRPVVEQDGIGLGE